MDTYEATKIVMSRIQNLDPENASKIMGYILIQDQGDKEMIRLAFGPETLLQSYISQAKTYLGILTPSCSNNNNTPSCSNSSNPTFIRPRILIPNNNNNKNVFNFSSNPSSPAFQQRNSPRPFSYAAALNTGNSNTSVSSNTSSVTTTTNNNNVVVGSGSPRLNFYGSNDGNCNDFGDGYFDEGILNSPSGRSDSLVFPYGEDSVPSPNYNAFHHRRSCSVNDASGFLGGSGNNGTSLDDGFGGGFGGWRPCMYFARGFCKNGGNCKFVHSDSFGSSDGGGVDLGSPSSGSNNGGGGGSLSGFDDLLRMRALQQQRRLALMAAAASSGGGGHNAFGFNKSMDFLNENPRSAAAALMMGDEFRKFNRFRPDSNDFSPLGLCSSSRQIYLTFPADSTFKEDDVSGYFSMFGPVQDVRIPYQQKRMFGFVTFVYAETVNLILAKGNPHFVCDSRVLVKPYKEKGKVAEKKQQMERGDYSACLSPSGLDSREHFDLPFGSRMLMSAQELILRRKLEQEAELQHAIELQNRRMMNLQLMDLKNQNHNNHNLMPNFPVSSPRPSQLLMNHKFTASSNGINHEDSEEFDGSPEAAKFNKKFELEGTESSTNNNSHGGDKQPHVDDDESDLPESMEHVLPDNLFASPTKLAAAESKSIFSQASADNNSNSVKMTPSNENTELANNSSPLNMASLKSCYFQMPRFSSGQEAIEM